MGFWKRLLFFWRKKEQPEMELVREERNFFSYIPYVPKILTYYRREKGIPKKALELVLIDNEEQPAWKVQQAAELLLPDLNFLYLVTRREEAFEELTELALEEYGLLIALLPRGVKEELPGNLTLDLNDWERHLDIVSALSYNT